MSNVQIPNLPVATSLSGNEEIEIVQAGVSRRTTTGAIANVAGLGPTGPTGRRGGTRNSAHSASLENHGLQVSYLLLGIDADG